MLVTQDAISHEIRLIENGPSTYVLFSRRHFALSTLVDVLKTSSQLVGSLLNLDGVLWYGQAGAIVSC